MLEDDAVAVKKRCISFAAVCVLFSGKLCIAFDKLNLSK